MLGEWWLTPVSKEGGVNHQILDEIEIRINDYNNFPKYNVRRVVVDTSSTSIADWAINAMNDMKTPTSLRNGQ
jgi:hypothetical protein